VPARLVPARLVPAFPEQHLNRCTEHGAPLIGQLVAARAAIQKRPASTLDQVSRLSPSHCEAIRIRRIMWLQA